GLFTYECAARTKVPTVGSKVPTAKPTVAAVKGNRGKAVKASACWIWKPKQNQLDQGSKLNGGIPQDNIDDKGYWDSVKRIFRYLKGHPKLGLWYPKESPFDLVAFSTTGGCQFLGRRLISWQCKKQTIVATSTTEAEYVAAASGCGQVLWIQNQLLDYGVFLGFGLTTADEHVMMESMEQHLLCPNSTVPTGE
ncbi:hypothetical protein Tco_0508132, partial [Tanacetum coccineum]